MVDPIVRFSVLFYILYFFVSVTLVVASLALRYVRKIASLTEQRVTELREEQERLRYFYDEKYKSLESELESERQERMEAQKNQEQEREQRLEAQHQAEQAKQEAMKEATLQLRGQMDLYLKELDGDGRRDIHSAK